VIEVAAVNNFHATRRGRGILLSALIINLSYFWMQPAQAQANYPHKPVRLIVPSAAGGSPDAICRLAASELAQALGQAVVVDNKPGAGGAIAIQELAAAAPDGYTIGYGNVVTLAINKSLYAKRPTTRTPSPASRCSVRCRTPWSCATACRSRTCRN
jgi:tripartite-type tricarboxylate transporter receptor subunit TctC